MFKFQNYPLKKLKYLCLQEMLRSDPELLLNDDYPFRRIRPDTELGYSITAKKLTDFPDILNQFWETLDMGQIWAQVKQDYLTEIKKYDFDRMNHQLAFIWDYLRLKRRDQFVFVSVPNLLDSHYHAIGAKYENYWFMLESPGAGSYGLNVHEYLHSIVNPLVEDIYTDYREKLNGYYHAGKNMPMAKGYRHPVCYAYECMVRALDHRIRVMFNNNSTTITYREGRVAKLTQEGLLLVQPFFQLLLEFQNSGMNFEEFLPVMFEKLPDYSVQALSPNKPL